MASHQHLLRWEPEPSTLSPKSTAGLPGFKREKRSRNAKTKLCQDPNVYIDDCPNSPKRQRIRSKERSCKVPVALHPHSPLLVNLLFPARLVCESKTIRSMNPPSIAALRSMNQDPAKNETWHSRLQSIWQPPSCQQMATTKTREGEEIRDNDESADHGRIVPIAMVPSLACAEKGLERSDGLLSSVDDQTELRAQKSVSPRLCPGPAVDTRVGLSPAGLCEEAQNRSNRRLDTFRDDPPGQGVHALGMHSDKAIENAKDADAKQMMTPQETTLLQKQDVSECADSELSTPSGLLAGVVPCPDNREDARGNAGDGSTKTECASRGKDGMVCAGGIRHVPVSVCLAVPVVQTPSGPGTAPDNDSEPQTTRSSNPCGPSESEETRTASYISQPDCGTDDTASRKTVAQSPRPEPIQQEKDPQPTPSPDPMTGKLINLDISLNMAQKCVDIRSLLVTLDYLRYLPLKFTMLQQCALGQTVNNLRGHEHPDVAKSAEILVRLWRWVGVQYLKDNYGVEVQKNRTHHGDTKSQKKGPRTAVTRTAKSSKDLTRSIVHRLGSVIRDL